MPSREQYEQLPTSDPSDVEYQQAEEAAQRAVRFNPPAPAPWKRAALIFFVVALFIVAFRMRTGDKEPEIIHADRYVLKIISSLVHTE